MEFSRRELTKTIIAGVPLIVLGSAPAAPVLAQPSADNRVIAGVRMGVQTYSFHDVARGGSPEIIPTIISHMQQVGLTECEIMSAHIEKAGGNSTGWWVASRGIPGYAAEREAGRQFRLSTPVSFYEDVRKRFADAGISIYIYNINFNDTFTDPERDACFVAAKALGASGLMASTTISEVRRLVPFLEKHQLFFAAHNHNNVWDTDQFATPESFEKALAMSPYVRVTLDVGHYTAGNNDALDFVKKHHDRIVSLHVRDRKRNNGRNTPLGQGDAPIKEILQLIRDNRYPIRCYIELEYGSFQPPVDEVQRSLDYCRQCLVA